MGRGFPPSMQLEPVRLTDPEMTTRDAVIMMCDGNPGGLNVLMMILKEGAAIDPQAFDPIAHILTLDMFNIYGSRIWGLYKDVCGQNLSKTIAVIRALQLGITNINALSEAIENRGQGYPLDTVVKLVTERLPELKVAA